MNLRPSIDKILPWLKPTILSVVCMGIPYRIAFRSLNESTFFVIKSLFWYFDQRLDLAPLRFQSSWEVIIAACILAIPPIWFSGIASIGIKSKHRFAIVTCVIDWIAYEIMVPNYLFEYNPLDSASDTWLNLTFFVTLILLGIVIVPTLLDHAQDMSQTLTKRKTKLLILSTIIFPTSIIVPIGETLYSLTFDSTFWLFFRQSILTELPIPYYYLSDFIFSIRNAPTFPLGVMGWIMNFVFIYQIVQYSQGRIKQRPVLKLLLLGSSTLIPTILNNVFIVAMGYQPSSIIHLPIPSLFIIGLLVLRKLRPPMVSDMHAEEVEIPVPLLHRLRSRLWRKEE